MKKKLPFLMISLILFICSILSSCQYDSPKSIVGAQLNDRGELILTYSDDTTQNLGVVKGENGKDGKDGVDLTLCAHTYGDWETQLPPSCTSIGYATRSCSLCGNLDYLITNPLGHTYENPVDVVHNCQQHWINKTCTTCGDTALVEAKIEHNFADGSVCIDCGIELWQTHFIESEEYIEVSGVVGEKGVYTVIWWNIDRTWGVRIGRTISYNTQLEEYNWASDWVFEGFAGSPIHATLPESYQGQLLTSLGNPAGGAFAWTPSLESIIIPKSVNYIGPWSFQGCTSLTSVFLEACPTIESWAFFGCDNATLYYYSREQPTEEGNYWHYVNAEPVIWE